MKPGPCSDPHIAVALGLAAVFRGGLPPGVKDLEVKSLTVTERATDRPLLRGFGIGVEDAVGVEPDQDLCGEVFEF